MKIMAVGLLIFFGLQPGNEGANTPVIASFKFEPSIASRGSEVIIRVQIFDRQGQKDVIPVLYLEREGVELIKTPLYDNGEKQDTIPNDGFYTGRMTVPQSAALGKHWFVVYLFDRSMNRSNLLIQEFTVLRAQEVL